MPPKSNSDPRPERVPLPGQVWNRYGLFFLTTAESERNYFTGEAGATSLPDPATPVPMSGIYRVIDGALMFILPLRDPLPEQEKP